MLTQAKTFAPSGGANHHRHQILALVVLSFLCAFSLFACGGGGTGSANGGSITPPPQDFLDKDLMGDWVGSLVPEVAGKDAYSFYICCDENGIPYVGADAKTRDWSKPLVYTYAKVKPDGEFKMIIVDCANLYTFDGHIDAGRMSISGDYLMLHEGRLEGEGTFGAVLSAPGVFAIDDQVVGKWQGNALAANGANASVEFEVDANGSLLDYQFDGVSFDAGTSTTSFTLIDDAVGRLGEMTLNLSDGSQHQINHLLVDENGTRLGGLGFIGGDEIIFTLTKVQ